MEKQDANKVLKELETNIVIVKLANILINTALVFLFVFLLGTLFDFSYYFALGISLVLFIGMLIHLFIKQKYYYDVESKYPELNEKLRTVHDNVNKTNDITDSLKEDVLKFLHSISLSYFIDFHMAYLKVLLVAIFSVLIVVFAFLNVNLDVNMGFKLITDGNAVGANVSAQNMDLDYFEGNLSDVLGKKSVAKIGNKELNLIINPAESDADVNNIKKVSQEDFNSPSFPKEIYTSYDVSYNDKIAKDNQKLVKSYFEQISR